MFETMRPPKYCRCAPGGAENGLGAVFSFSRSCPCRNIAARDSLFGEVLATGAGLPTSVVSGCDAVQTAAPSVANKASFVRDTDEKNMDTLLECACDRVNTQVCTSGLRGTP